MTTKHGHKCRGKTSPTYQSWYAMRIRCNWAKHPQYKHYGGAGIKVCREWDDFAVFLADMGERPEGMTLERKRNSEGYNKDNCVWATRDTQSRNTKRNVHVTAFGETKVLADWSIDPRCAVTESALAYRIRKGWNPETALTKSARPGAGETS